MRLQKYNELKVMFDNKFEDLFQSSIHAFDVVMPILNTNALFKQNLISIYKNISVNRLLIGDAGCTDESIEVLKDFPRVQIINHKHFKTSGICVADLITKVETAEFYYLHSDVYLKNRYVTEVLEKQLTCADWVEGFRTHMTIVETTPDEYYTDERSYSGVQLGKTSILKKSVSKIIDGDLQRNEDIVIAELVKKNGGKYLKVKESIHTHQVMDKDGEHEPKIENIQIVKRRNIAWEIENWKIQIRGIVKHTSPSKYLILQVKQSMQKLFILGGIHSFNKELMQLRKKYPVWSIYLSPYKIPLWGLQRFLRLVIRKIKLFRSS
jgi:hypothetical protein